MPSTHRVFTIAVILKALDGLLELFGGLVLHFAPPGWLDSVVFRVTTHELSEDPSDVLANAARHAVLAFGQDTQRFATLYLLAHGVVKLVLVAALLREYRAAFPAALAFFGLFVAYQFYRFAHTHSIALLALSLVDIAVIAIVWREYRERYPRGGAVRTTGQR